MTTNILGSQIVDYTINTEQLSNTAVAAFAKSLSPKVLYANVASNTFTVLDDTAVNVGGGYIVVTGSHFQSGATVLIDTTPAAAVTYVNNTTLRVQVPAKSSASYNLYVVNPDGGTGIRVNGVTYSSEPTWVTISPLDDQLANTAFSVNLSATSATSYTLAAGSTLPDGTTLAANGYFSGTVTIETQTTYSFSVVATDDENQNSSKTFQVTVTVEPTDPYFNYTALLLQADDAANNSNNGTFVDSSNNNYAITKTGNVNQGSVNPFGVGNWSNYFDGSGDYLTATNTSAFGYSTGDFTIEFWMYLNSVGVDQTVVSNLSSASGVQPHIYFTTVGSLLKYYTNSGDRITSSALSISTWYHVAICRSSGSTKMFINGTQSGSTYTDSNDYGSSAPLGIGTYWSSGSPVGSSTFNGYISNVRILKGTALYTTNFTPSTIPLTAIANTSLLTCQSNNFKDNSNNALTLTAAGNSTVERFNPFAVKGIKYNANTDGGSMYFDGTGDYLTTASNSLDLGAGDFTVEFWLYSKKQAAYNSNAYTIVEGEYNGGGVNWGLGIVNYASFRGLTLSQGLYGSYVVGLYSNNYLKSDVWQHIAVTRSGSTHRMFVDGVEQSLATYNEGSTWNNSFDYTKNSQVRYIGGAHHSSPMYGYINNFRIVKGTALYTSGFTPPTSALTAIANTSFLLSNKNSGIYDATMQNNVETVGDAKVSTNVTKYGTGSIYFDGTGDILSVPHTNSIDLSSGDFTIETWVYWNSYVAGSAVMAKGTGPYVAYLIYVGDAAGGTEVDFYTSISGSAWSVSGLNFTINPTLGVWHHLAVTRSGNVYRTFFNGTLANSVTQAGTLMSQSAAPPLIVGKYNVGNTFNGYIDDLRITKGYARYTSNFTLPTRLGAK